MGSDFFMFYQVLMFVWSASIGVVHLILAIAVWTSQPPPRRVLLSKGLWGVVVLLGGVTAAAVYWVLHYGLITRIDRSVCSTCGYDRKGLSAGVPCPECGTP